MVLWWIGNAILLLVVLGRDWGFRGYIVIHSPRFCYPRR